MRRFRFPTVIVGLLAGLVGFAAAPGVCLACSCLPPPGPLEARDQAAAVFRGSVIAINTERASSGYQYQRVTLHADTVWKGAVTREMTIYTGSGGGDCGFPFQQGQSYLIYASNVSGSGPSQHFPAGALATGICSRSKTLDRAGDDLAALGPGSPPSDAPLPTLPNTGAGHSPTRSTPPFTPALLALLLAAALPRLGTPRRRNG